MKVWVHLCVAVAAVGLLGLASPAHAIVPVVFGTSWDGPGKTLQDIVDARYGAGKINVKTDYIGAKAGDLDPWFWVGNFAAVMMAKIAGNADYNVVGWYMETNSTPVLDPAHSGVLFVGPGGIGAQTVVTFNQPMTKFGFYLQPKSCAGQTLCDYGPQTYFTNRRYNDIGPCGTGALHPPVDGDVQALVFDVTKFVPGGASQPTWLVCFEDLDSGRIPQPCCNGTDNDFNDAVFEVTALGATPAATLSFGALKARYRP